MVRKVLRLKSERPSLFASEIREALLSQRLCDPGQVPSVSSINRILREAATATTSLAAEWPAFTAHQLFANGPNLPAPGPSGLPGPLLLPSLSSSAGFAVMQMLDLTGIQQSLPGPSAFEPLDLRSSESEASSPSAPPKRKKVSYAIEDLLKKDDAS